MNYARVVIAGLIATIVFFTYGFLIFGVLIAKYYAPYPGVYRSAASLQSYIPIGVVSTFVAILVLTLIYAKGYEGGSGVAGGFRFGLLVGIFVVCAVVADEYVTLNIGRGLALAMAAGRLTEWSVIGVTIGLIYKPTKPSVG
jgi:hypothetical protein